MLMSLQSTGLKALCFGLIGFQPGKDEIIGFKIAHGTQSTVAVLKNFSEPLFHHHRWAATGSTCARVSSLGLLHWIVFPIP